MSLYGVRWTIDGVKAAFVRSRGKTNREYAVVFEREYASLEDVEAINWQQPQIERVGTHSEEGLPEGYGFEVHRIAYNSPTRCWEVYLKTAKQYWGDTTGYQEQVEELQNQVTALTEQAAEKDAVIEAQLQEINGRAADLAAAYAKGVESIG